MAHLVQLTDFILHPKLLLYNSLILFDIIKLDPWIMILSLDTFQTCYAIDLEK